jgi:hypothetical protein
MPIVASAVFVFIALSIIHVMLDWHKGDMTAVPGEAKVMETLPGLNVQPGDYRFLARRHHLRPDHRRDVAGCGRTNRRKKKA